jgi:tRNA(Ile)-lysidine synthase
MWSELLKRVDAFISGHGLLNPHERHIVALSGGADSVALLLVLRRLGYRVEAAHCNFKLRAGESDRDEQFVRSLCQQTDTPFHVVHFDTKTYASQHQVSIEMAARHLRYRYFEQLRTDIEAAEVCVAHHQDDAVETLLMNLLRGAGIHGLTGIRPRNGHVVRPLLCVSRSDILQFLQAQGQPYVTDSTNLVPDVVRNRLRLQVLPLLSDINPSAAANIAKSANLLAEAERVYGAAVTTAIDGLLTDGQIDTDRLLAQPSPLCLLHEVLAPRGFTSAQVRQLLGALRSEPGRVFTSETHEVIVDRRRLVIAGRRPPLPTLTIPEEGLYRYADGMSFRVALSSRVAVSREASLATVDAAAVKFPLTVRPIAVGDRFQPFGMKGSRLVSDYLTDRKLTVFQKRRQLVVADAQGRIVWLVGQRTDQRFAVGDDTSRLLILELLKDEKDHSKQP